MSYEALIAMLEEYVPLNEQEACDKAQMLALGQQCGESLLSRENLAAHFTASAWILNQEHSHLLMAFHNLYDSWSWLGGHADGDADLAGVALKEAREESGLTRIRLLLDRRIFSLESLCVDGHEKRGQYVPSHLHLNVTYLLEADSTETVHMKPDENQAVQWFPVKEAPYASNETWFVHRIYEKLNQKLESLGYIQAF